MLYRYCVSNFSMTAIVRVKPQRAYALSHLDEQLNFAPLQYEALH